MTKKAILLRKSLRKINKITLPTGIKNTSSQTFFLPIVLGKVEHLFRHGCSLEHNTSAKLLDISRNQMSPQSRYHVSTSIQEIAPR